MTTETLKSAAVVRPSADTDTRVTLPRVVRMEWIKFWSVRSTVATLLTAIALLIGFGLLVTSLSDPEPSGVGMGDALSASLAGVTLAVVAMAVLGVMTSASE